MSYFQRFFLHMCLQLKMSLRTKRLVLRCWTSFVAAVMRDENFPPDSSSPSGKELKFSPGEKWLNLARDNLSNQGQILAGLSAAVVVSDDPGTSEGALDGFRYMLPLFE